MRVKLISVNQSSLLLLYPFPGSFDKLILFYESKSFQMVLSCWRSVTVFLEVKGQGFKHNTLHTQATDLDFQFFI